MSTPHLIATYASTAEFLTACDKELKAGGLLVRGASVERAVAQGECTVEVRVEGQVVAQLPARLAAVVPGLGVAVTFPAPPEPLLAAALRVRTGGPLVEPSAAPEAAAEPAEAAEPEAPEHDEESHKPEYRSVSERIHSLSVAQKIQLALVADRQERFVLLRDTNKVLHAYVLRNPKTGLDEVQAAAKMKSLSADAIKYIAEHTQWSANPIVCANLVRNPATPLALALKLLDRIPLHDVKAIAKGTGTRMQIVQAARKKLNS